MVGMSFRDEVSESHRRQIGECLRRVIGGKGWTVEQAAAHLGLTGQQLGAWLSGRERMHLDRLLFDQMLGVSMAVEICRVAGADVEQVVTFPAKKVG